MPIFFRCSGVYLGRGALGPNAQNFRGVKFFFALHLILSGKLHICGRDDLFFAFQIRFLTL